MHFRNANRVRFADNTIVEVADCHEYLGALIDSTFSIDAELSARIRKACATWKSLNLLWSRACTSDRHKILTYESVIRAIVVYGLEGAQLNENHFRRLNAFQLKGLRKILGITTTYVDRSHTNA